MILRRLLLPFLVAGLWGLLGVPAIGQVQPVPSERYPSVGPSSALPVKSLPPVDTDALRAEAEAQDDGIGPYTFAKDLETDVSPHRQGTWERLSSEQWLWRLRIRSRDAVSLNLAFTEFQLPKGAKLYVHDSNNEIVHGPYTKADATKGQLWTPIVQGSEVIVELTVPDGRRSDLALHLTQVNHGFRSLKRTAAKRATEKSRACNIDVSCPQADPWSDQVRSVGAYSADGTDLCSGSLVNNTNEDETPYFLTAEHCLQGSEDLAASMVFYWNYQNPTCRTPGSDESGTVTSDDRTDQTSTGAILRMSYGNVESQNQIAGKPDVTLVEIDEPLPDAYHLFLNGWDRTDFAPSEAVSIHHPQLHGKRITFERNQTSIEGFRDPDNDTHIHVNWDEGTTEGGSSGSPLYAPNQKVVGVLSGGETGCEIEDWYGRIHKAWDGGGTPDTRLRDWLDPADTDAKRLDGYSLSEDTIPPARVQNFSVQEVTTDSITLAWTAPGNDDMKGTARLYDLRFRASSPQFRRDVSITTREDFRDAERISSIPLPDSAGTRQTIRVPIDQDSSYYFGIIALDEADNISPLATINRDVTPVSELRTTSPTPNPARQQTLLRVVTETAQHVRVDLYDALGRRVATLFNDEIPPFRQQNISIDVSPLSSGIYFAHVQGENGRVETRKISVVK